MSLLNRALPPVCAIALCGVLSLLAYPFLDEQVPVHWGIDGRVDAYASRSVAVLLNPAGAAVAFLFFTLIPYADKRRVAQLRELGVYDPLRNVAVFGFTYAHVLALGTGVNAFPPDANFVVGLAGLLTALAGYEMRLKDAGALSFARRLSAPTRTTVGSVCLGAGLLAAAGGTTGLWPAVCLGLLLVAAGWATRRALVDSRA